jgi:hypothetical protein
MMKREREKMNVSIDSTPHTHVATIVFRDEKIVNFFPSLRVAQNL